MPSLAAPGFLSSLLAKIERQTHVGAELEKNFAPYFGISSNPRQAVPKNREKADGSIPVSRPQHPIPALVHSRFLLLQAADVPKKAGRATHARTRQ